MDTGRFVRHICGEDTGHRDSIDAVGSRGKEFGLGAGLVGFGHELCCGFLVSNILIWLMGFGSEPSMTLEEFSSAEVFGT